MLKLLLVLCCGLLFTTVSVKAEQISVNGDKTVTIIGENHVDSQGQCIVQNSECQDYGCVYLEWSINGNICLEEYLSGKIDRSKFITCMINVAKAFGGSGFPQSFANTVDAAKACGKRVLFVDASNPLKSPDRNEIMCKNIHDTLNNCDGMALFPVGNSHLEPISMCLREKGVQVKELSPPGDILPQSVE